MPITTLELAIHRGAKPDSDGSFSMESVERTGLAFFAGCSCTASLAAFNSYPSKSGYTACKDCIGSNGFETVEEANAAIFPPEDEECDCNDCAGDCCDSFDDAPDSRLD